MPAPTGLITAGQLERRPEDLARGELVAGRFVPMTPVGFEHGRVVCRLLFLLARHLEGHDLGVAVTEVGLTLATDPDTVRAPDVAFIRQDRIPPLHQRGFLRGPVDLVIEVLSPDDRAADVSAKTEEYLTHGVIIVLVVDPDAKTVGVHRRLSLPLTLRDADTLDIDDVVAGFRCDIREIFK